MDPVVLAALIGGGSVCAIIWGAVLILHLIDKRRGKRGTEDGKTWNQRIADGDI